MLKVRGRGQHGDECGHGFAEVGPVDVRDGLRHQCAYQDESGGGGVARNRSGQRRTEHGEQKERGDEYVAESGAGPCGDSGDALDVTGHRGGARQRSENRSGRIGQQRPSDARYFSVLDESALLAHSYQGAYVVEEVHEQKGKQDFQKPKMDGAAKIKLQKSGRRVGHGDDGGGPTARCREACPEARCQRCRSGCRR